MLGKFIYREALFQVIYSSTMQNKRISCDLNLNHQSVYTIVGSNLFVFFSFVDEVAGTRSKVLHKRSKCTRKIKTASRLDSAKKKKKCKVKRKQIKSGDFFCLNK